MSQPQPIGTGVTGLFAHWVEDWSQLRSGWNWRTFRFVLLEFEDDRMMGAVEATLVILGLGFRVRWTYALTERMQRILKARQEAAEMNLKEMGL